MTTSLTRRAALAGSAALALGPSAHAEANLATPSGPVLLEVGGSIRLTNGGDQARLDRGMLNALSQTGFETSSPWMEKPARFDGIAGATLVEALGAFGREVVAVALNDYRVTIPFADFAPGGLLIASQVDGKPIPIRARGPLWIVYPFDSKPAFRSELFYSRSIWQLRRLEFRS
jgi:hypothetical protein